MTDGATTALELFSELTRRSSGHDPSPVVDFLLHEGRSLPHPGSRAIREWLDDVHLRPGELDMIEKLRQVNSARASFTGQTWHALRNLRYATRGHYGIVSPGHEAQPDIPSDRPLTFAVDLDETCYDWMTPFAAATATELRVDPVSLVATTSYDMFLEWGIDWPTFHRINAETIRAGTAFTTGQMLPHANEGVAALKAAGHKVIVVTARGAEGLDKQTRDSTESWLDEHGFEFDELYFTPDKTSIPWDVIVDDSPRNINNAIDAGRWAIVYSQPWNHRVTYAARRYRAFGWENVLRHAKVEVPW